MECGRKAQAVGGLIFRCECCPAAYCEDHLPIDSELVGHCKRFEDLGMRHMGEEKDCEHEEQAHPFVCAICSNKRFTTAKVQLMKQMQRMQQQQMRNILQNT